MELLESKQINKLKYLYAYDISFCVHITFKSIAQKQQYDFSAFVKIYNHFEFEKK